MPGCTNYFSLSLVRIWLILLNKNLNIQYTFLLISAFLGVNYCYGNMVLLTQHRFTGTA
jgi:hypothetical protein